MILSLTLTHFNKNLNDHKMYAYKIGGEAIEFDC